jgi:cation diffusion facilitator family transporter
VREPSPHIPEEVAAALEHAKRLEYWTIGLLASIVLVVGLTMGSSQAMRTAWVEDLLSLLPPISFLIATRLEKKDPTRKYPHGFSRTHSLAFFASATALTVMGALLFYEAAATLIRQEHPTIGSIRLFGREVWLGWLMIAALTYSVIPPVILGRLKKPVAETLSDEVLHTDALMNKADWQTGLAGVVGILGVAFGYWWTDAVAAGFIAFSIFHDGIKAFGISVAELVDGAPRKLGTLEVDPLVEKIERELKSRYPEAAVRTRETGRYIHVLVEPEQEPDLPLAIARDIAGPEDAWRIIDMSVAVREKWPAAMRQEDKAARLGAPAQGAAKGQQSR